MIYVLNLWLPKTADKYCHNLFLTPVYISYHMLELFIRNENLRLASITSFVVKLQICTIFINHF